MLAYSSRGFIAAWCCFLLGVILFAWRVRWPHGPLGSGLLVWYRECFITLLVIFYIEELIFLLQALAELGIVDFPAVAIGISSNSWTGSVGRKS